MEGGDGAKAIEMLLLESTQSAVKIDCRVSENSCPLTRHYRILTALCCTQSIKKIECRKLDILGKIISVKWLSKQSTMSDIATSGWTDTQT